MDTYANNQSVTFRISGNVLHLLLNYCKKYHLKLSDLCRNSVLSYIQNNDVKRYFDRMVKLETQLSAMRRIDEEIRFKISHVHFHYNAMKNIAKAVIRVKTKKPLFELIKLFKEKSRIFEDKKVFSNLCKVERELKSKKHFDAAKVELASIVGLLNEDSNKSRKLQSRTASQY